MRMKKRLEAGSGLFFLAMRTPGEGERALRAYLRAFMAEQAVEFDLRQQN